MNYPGWVVRPGFYPGDERPGDEEKAMREVSYDEVKATLEAVVAERGADYVYPREWRDPDDGSCRYVRPDGEGPACIVGAVYVRLGVPLEFLRSCEGDGSHTVSQILAEDGILHLDDDAALLLRYAQINQDRLMSWGDAVAAAIRRLPGGEGSSAP